LLRVLEDRQVVPIGGEPEAVNVRIISATHRNLLERVEDGSFREDLYYRLNGLEVALPALRERSDKSQLLDFLLAEEAGGETIVIDEAARQALLAFAWPGNVRQLRNVLRTLAALCDEGRIGLDDLPAMIRQAPAVRPVIEESEHPLEDAERLALLNALEQTRWHMTQTASSWGQPQHALQKAAQTRIARKPTVGARKVGLPQSAQAWSKHKVRFSPPCANLRPCFTRSTMHIHILGICGTFMGSMAVLAKELGHHVTGSDANVYPPMSTQLEAQGIELTQGYDPAQLDPAPDLVVIGNAMSRGNPAVEYVLNKGLPYVSGPQWLADHVLQGRWVLAVAGTHGKTTTSSMLAWVLEHAGMSPGFLIGGVPQNFSVSARLGDTPFFVIEADEYDSAFFDKRSKFVHYRPRTAILNNLEFDHADIFPDLPAIERQFHHLVRTIRAKAW
jgi:hypothetical protein